MQAVDRFNVEQKVEMSARSYARANLDRLIAVNDHHGANFDRFREVCARQDPNRKFANSFTRRLFRD